MNFNFDSLTTDTSSFLMDDLSSDEMAVVGVSFELPGANTWEALWGQLTGQRDNIKTFPKKRHNDLSSYLKRIRFGENNFVRGGYIDEIDKFDYAYFRLSPKEASLMDPHQRMFLETAWSALEDAGYGGKALSGKRVGVYIGHSGFSPFSYFRMLMDICLMRWPCHLQVICLRLLRAGSPICLTFEDPVC